MSDSQWVPVLVLFLILLPWRLSAQQPAPWHDPSPHDVQFVTVGDNVKLEVLDWGGSGRPLVFLAGYTTAHIYDEIAPKLTDVAHVYGITRRGLGLSSKTASGYTAQESADDVLQVLDALNLSNPVLIGHSFGGQDLSTLGAKYPQRMAGLVYLNSAEDPSLGPVSGKVSRPLRGQLPEALQTLDDNTSFSAYRERQKADHGLAFPEAELRQLFASNPDGTVGAYLVPKNVRDAMFAGIEAPDYTRIQVPVLAFFAVPMALEDQIKLYRPKNTEEEAALGTMYAINLAWVARNRDALKRGLPHAQTVELVGASMYIFLSNETDVEQGLRAFLAGLH
jgi:non-heme chloroperoxidase